MGGKTKTTQQSNSTQTVAPPSWTMPGIATLSDKVNAAAGTQAPAYTGGFVAGVNNQPAIDAYKTAAGAGAGYAGLVDNAISGYKPVTPTFGMSSLPTFASWTNPNNDATMRDAISGEANAVTRNLLSQVLPSIRSSALDAGAYSGDRASAILPGLALDDATRNVSEIASKYVYQNANDNANRDLTAFNNNNNLQLQGFQADTQRGLGVAELAGNQQTSWMNQLPDLIQTAMQMRTGQGDILQGAAQLEQQQQQFALDDALQRHQYAVTRPYEGLDLAANLLTQLSGNYGTTTGNSTNVTTQKTGGLGAVVSGLAGLAGAVGSFPTGGGSTLLSQLFKPKAKAA